MVETKMTVDGKDTGIKLDLDLNYVFKAVIVAALIGGMTFLFSINGKLSDISSQQKLSQFQIDLISKKIDGYATNDQVSVLSKQISDCMTKSEAEQRGKMRDMQVDDLRARLVIMETRKR